MVGNAAGPFAAVLACWMVGQHPLSDPPMCSAVDVRCIGPMVCPAVFAPAHIGKLKMLNFAAGGIRGKRGEGVSFLLVVIFDHL